MDNTNNNEQEKGVLTKLAQTVLSEWKHPKGSVGNTVIYPTGPASGLFHPNHPDNPANTL